MSESKYTLFKRKDKQNWYCRFFLSTGKYKDLSTGCKNKDKANIWAYQTAQKELHLIKNPRITLQDFTGKDFFSWDGIYCRNRRSTGKRITESQAQNKTAELIKVILPYFGSYRLNQITESEIENFRNTLTLDKGYAGSTVNKVLYTDPRNLNQKKDLFKV